VRFTSAITGADAEVLNTARDAVVEIMGSPAVVTASIIAANFSMLDRIANAIGISLDGMTLKPSADIRELLGINNYPSAANTLER
jgi:5,10-methenyltetrahydromethanopterin hydrogenase